MGLTTTRIFTRPPMPVGRVGRHERIGKLLSIDGRRFERLFLDRMERQKEVALLAQREGPSQRWQEARVDEIDRQPLTRSDGR